MHWLEDRRRWRAVRYWIQQAAGVVVLLALAASFVIGVITIVHQLMLQESRL